MYKSRANGVFCQNITEHKQSIQQAKFKTFSLIQDFTKTVVKQQLKSFTKLEIN